MSPTSEFVWNLLEELKRVIPEVAAEDLPRLRRRLEELKAAVLTRTFSSLAASEKRSSWPAPQIDVPCTYFLGKAAEPCERCGRSRQEHVDRAWEGSTSGKGGGSW